MNRPGPKSIAAAFALLIALAGCVNTAEIRELEQDCIREMAEGSKKPATLEKAEKLCADRFAVQKKEAFEKDSDEFAAGVGTVLTEIARTLEEHHIKRVPVIRDGQLVGIVSRANLLHGLASRKEAAALPSAATNQAIREDILHTLKDEKWATLTYANVTVEDGVAHLWGMAETDAQIKALEIVAGNATGVTSVENHMSTIGPQMFYGE